MDGAGNSGSAGMVRSVSRSDRDTVFAGGAVDLSPVAAGQADAAAGGILLLCGYQYHQPVGGQQDRSEIMFEGRGIMGRRRLIIVLAAFCAAGWHVDGLRRGYR